MTDEILNDTESQMKLKIVADKYIKKVEIFLCKFSDKFCAVAALEFLSLSEIVSFLCDIIVHMNFIIDLICLDVSDSLISDYKWFVDTSVKKNSSFFLQWEKNENAWKKNYLNCKIQKILFFYLWLKCDCFFFLYFRIFILTFTDKINMIFLILVNFFKSFCFSDW